MIYLNGIVSKLESVNSNKTRNGCNNCFDRTDRFAYLFVNENYKESNIILYYPLNLPSVIYFTSNLRNPSLFECKLHPLKIWNLPWKSFLNISPHKMAESTSQFYAHIIGYFATVNLSNTQGACPKSLLQSVAPKHLLSVILSVFTSEYRTTGTVHIQIFSFDIWLKKAYIHRGAYFKFPVLRSPGAMF